MKIGELYNKKDKTKMNKKLNDFNISVPETGKIVAIARHGSTNNNGDKVFRGWEENPDNQLTDKGIQDAKNLGESVKKMIGKDNPNDYVLVCSDLNRAQDTADIVSQITGIPLGKSYKELRSQDTGDFTGKKEKDVKKEITNLIDKNPNKPLPGASESHVEFLNRVKGILSPDGKIAKDYPKKKIIAILHHQVEVEQANNFSSATDAMFDKGIEPGGLRKV